MAEFDSGGPIAILALLQTSTSNGVQYATMVPTDKETLRRNSYVFVPQPLFALLASDSAFMPVDVDEMRVDYNRMIEGAEGYSMDFTYETESKTARSFVPRNGAGFAKLGKKDAASFDALSLAELQALQYTSTKIDLTDNAEALAEEYAFAVRTEIGHYAKVRLFRIVEVVDQQDGIRYRDIGLEVCVYR